MDSFEGNAKELFGEAREIQVPAIYLPDYCAENNIKYIHTYFSDIQGMDLSVLKTMQDFIDGGRISEIICEVAKDEHRNIYSGIPENSFSSFVELLGGEYVLVASGWDDLQDGVLKGVPEGWWEYNCKWRHVASPYRDGLHMRVLAMCDLSPEATVEHRNPLDLLTSNRLDILARYEFISRFLCGQCVDYGKHVYLSVISAWHSLSGGFDPGKFSMDDYVQSFAEMAMSMREDGFDSERSLIPIVDGTIVDGAHRVAAALALGIDSLPCIAVRGKKQDQCEATLKRVGVDSALVDSLIVRHVEIDDRIRLAVLFPCAHGSVDEAMGIIERNAEVLYRHSVRLTRRGQENLATLIYGQHDWWSAHHEVTFAGRRYRRNMDTLFVFFRGCTDVLAMKAEVRSAVGLGNDAIHTTDTHFEACELARHVLNPNSVDALNYSRSSELKVFPRLLDVFATKLRQANECIENYAIDSGGALAVYGLRDVTDLDFISTGAIEDISDGSVGVSSHNDLFFKAPLRLDLIINDPRHHFYWHGIKYVSLDLVRFVKSCDMHGKNKRDIMLIDSRKRAMSTLYRFVASALYRVRLRCNVRAIMALVIPAGASFLKKALGQGRYVIVRDLFRKYFR